MIWGSQWDQIMIWMKEVKNGENYYITNSIGMGNLNISGVDDGYDSFANTGCFDIKNIFDLAGNVYDRTLEAYGGSRSSSSGAVTVFTSVLLALA